MKLRSLLIGSILVLGAACADDKDSLYASISSTEPIPVPSSRQRLACGALEAASHAVSTSSIE